MAENIVSQLIWVGLIIGMLYGALIQRTQFCMGKCFTEIKLLGTLLQLKAYLLAVLVAMIGTKILIDLGIVDPNQSIYLPTEFPWLGFVVGGYIFGMGLVMAQGCASRIWVRMGEGNLGSLLSVFGVNIGAGSALAGHLAYSNEHFFRKFTATLPSSSIPELLGVSPWILIGVFALVLAVWIAKSAKEDDFLGVKWPLTSLAVGLLVVAGWYVTGSAAAKTMGNEALTAGAGALSRFHPGSLTFVKPNADFFGYLRTAAGSTMNFGMGTVVGLTLGSFIAAKVSRTFYFVVPPDKKAFFSYFGGGVLMGYGGVLAMGCNVGQGLTGMSIWGLGGVLTVTFIMLGIWTVLWIIENTA